MAKVGPTCDATTTLMVAVVPHWPGLGVNVNVVVPGVDVLIEAGFQVPVIPLVEVVGKGGGTVLLHCGGICAKLGITCEVTTTFIVAVAAHWPAAGVKVYAVVPVSDVLIEAGLHVPVIPLVDVVGNPGAVAFWHKAPIGANVGVTSVETTIFIVIVVPHCEAGGVNVYVVVPTVAVFIVAGLHVPVTPFVDVVGNTGGVEF